MRGSALDWMHEPLSELSSWNRAIVKRLEAEERASKKK
jgi:hypothetical protein|nr:MAG TPA: hypothetical protein [Caudoviricetes sp.]DAY59590.1 MAG TPA: hypothetical protein [Caudoviricetes sp.]